MPKPPIPAPLVEPTDEAGPPGLLRTIAPPLVAFAILGVLLYPHAGEVWDSAKLVSLEAAAALVVLHLIALVLRAEAWGMCVAAAGASVERPTLHSTSAFRFLADTVVPTYVGAWVRVVLLRRLEGERAPTVGQMITADGVILLVEAVITVGLLSLAVATTSVTWWQAALFALAVAAICAVCVLLRRRFSHRPFARAFDVLRGSGQRRGLLTLILAAVLLIQPVRFWLALDAVGLDPTAAEALAAFLLTSVFGVLPIGPGPSSIGASTAVFGSAALAEAGAAGLILASAATAAAALYCIYGGPTLLRRSREPAASATELAPAPTASRPAPSTPSGTAR